VLARRIAGILAAGFTVSGCANDSDSKPVTPVLENQAVNEARKVMRAEYPLDSYDLERTELRNDPPRRRWLVVFEFANEDGEACVFVNADRVGSGEEVDCAIVIDP
jgi:hypothetical protein